MGDALKKVKSGDPLVIPAATFNTFIDTARDYRGRKTGQGQTPSSSHRELGIVPVKNASGSDVARFGVLGISGTVFAPADRAATYRAGGVSDRLAKKAASESGCAG